MKTTAPNALDDLIKRLARLPGLGPRSARKIALHLLTEKQRNLYPLMQSLEAADQTINPCGTCGNLDVQDPCHVCKDERRDRTKICVIAHVSDLWAIERSRAFKGVYHILGGVLSALDGIGPDNLAIPALLHRVDNGDYQEIILALSATVDGQATGHYLVDKLVPITDAQITRLAHGVPVGGELGYLDDGTITTALRSRSQL